MPDPTQQATTPQQQQPTPPPDPAAVSAVPRTGKERVLGFLGGVAKAAGGDTNSLDAHLQQHYQQRLDEARMNKQNAATYAGILAHGSSPDASENGPDGKLTPEARAKYANWYKLAMDGYQKSAGVTKEAKGAVGKARAMIDGVIAHASGKQPQQAQPQQPASKLPPPPQAQASTTQPSDGSAAAPAASAASATPTAAPGASPEPAASTGLSSPPAAQQSAPGLPPPPSPPPYDDRAKFAAPGLRQDAAAQHLADEKTRAILSERRTLAAQGGLAPGSRDYQEYMATGKFPSQTDKWDVRPDKNGNLIAVDKSDPRNVIHVTDSDGAPVTGATKPGITPKVALVQGIPYGVTRPGADGKPTIVTPDSPDWTPADAVLFSAANQAAAKADKAKADRMQEYYSAYAKMRGQVYQYGVIDSTTGDLTYANANTINQNPGRYAPGSLAQQLKNRQGIFDEIDYTTGQMESAIKNLGDQQFDADQRAQLALALKDTDPRSAISQFIGSSVGTTLTSEQIDYVTALVSMQESAMSLRSIAGMGAGSDMLRSAIINMLPSARTPSRAYAERQMKLFKGELTQLRRPLPSEKSLGMPGGSDSGNAKKPGGLTSPPTPPPAPPKTADEYLKSIAPH